MKDIFKTVFLFTSSLYTVVYMCVTFVIWEFRNPFQWIIDIPTYDLDGRGKVLCCVIFYYLLAFFYAKIFIDMKKKKEDES